MAKELPISTVGAHPYYLTTGELAGVTYETMQGLWSLRYGVFGCRDSETEGGVMHIEGDRMAAGGNHFIFHGRYVVRTGGIDVFAKAIRRLPGSPFDQVYDHPETVFPICYEAEAISRDHLEGRIRQPGAPDTRIVLRRFA